VGGRSHCLIFRTAACVSLQFVDLATGSAIVQSRRRTKRASLERHVEGCRRCKRHLGWRPGKLLILMLGDVLASSESQRKTWLLEGVSAKNVRLRDCMNFQVFACIAAQADE